MTFLDMMDLLKNFFNKARRQVACIPWCYMPIIMLFSIMFNAVCPQLWHADFREPAIQLEVLLTFWVGRMMSTRCLYDGVIL